MSKLMKDYMKNFAVLHQNLAIEGDNLRCEFVFLGEGYGGDYDSDDPSDAPLLRLFVQMNTVLGWREVRGGNFCTQIDMREPVHELLRVLAYLWQAYHQELRIKGSCKNLSERVSHMDLKTVLKEAEENGR